VRVRWLAGQGKRNNKVDLPPSPSLMLTLGSAEGMTMIVVTHEITFAADVAHRILVMADGAVIEDGPPSSVLKNPTSPRSREFFRAILDRQ